MAYYLRVGDRACARGTYYLRVCDHTPFGLQVFAAKSHRCGCEFTHRLCHDAVTALCRRDLLFVES